MISIRRFDWVLHLATIAICSYLLATSAVTYIAGMLEAGAGMTQNHASTPVSSSSKAVGNIEDYQVIFDRNIFSSASTASLETEDSSELNPSQMGELGPAVKTNLDIKLMGTLVIGSGKDRFSSAIISGGKDTKGAATYFVDDAKSFAPNVKITQVSKNRVEFINNGRLEFVEKDDSAKQSIFSTSDDVFGKNASVASKSAGDSSDVTGKVVIDQKDIDDALQNLDRLYNDVRIVPNFKDGRPAGMKVLSVKPGSLISKLGVKRGDVLEKVNGQDLDIKKGMEMFNQMKDMKNFSVEIERGGRNQTLEYEIR